MPGRGLRLKIWQEMQASPNLFVIVAADSGTGKSRTLSEVLKPVREMEQKRLAEWKEDVEPGLKAESRRLNQKIKRLEKKEDFEAGKELEDAEKRSAEIARDLHTPALLVGDVTAEALGAMLSYNSEVRERFDRMCAHLPGIERRLLQRPGAPRRFVERRLLLGALHRASNNPRT